MLPFEIVAPSEQVARYLRSELLRGKWSGEMPGAPLLATELVVDRKTVEAGLCLLEKEGLLVTQGAGRRRKIVPLDRSAPRALRVCLMTYSDEDTEDVALKDLLHRTEAAGHVAGFANQSVASLIDNPQRLERCVKKAAADAWVVYGGSREVLGWFAQNGRMHGFPIAGVKPDKIPAQSLAVRRLVALGHRRIVSMVLPERVTPATGNTEQCFIDDLEAAGIPTGPYNLAIWDGTMEGFYKRLDALFRHTPPTALLLHASALFISAQLYLARRGILAPEHVSLFSYDPDPYFVLLDPAPTHIHWSFDDMARRVERWIDNIARGKDDRRQSFTKARFVEGGTIGPVNSGFMSS
jgi:putative intracellular protease/amidase